MGLTKTIIICGDRTEDHNLNECPGMKVAKQRVFAAIDFKTRKGGIDYLRELIEIGLDIGARNEIKTFILARPSKGAKTINLTHSYQLWAPFEQIKGAKDEKKVWRIKQTLGVKEEPVSLPDSSKESWPGAATGAEILVIDDLGLGFCDAIANIKEFFTAISPKQIVFKTSNLLNPSLLLRWLFEGTAESNKYLEKTTIVLSVAALRDRGASISRGLSWDKTIEETVAEMKTGCSSLDLARCARTIIHFGYEGIACFERARNSDGPVMKFFLYHPWEHEGMFLEKRPGMAFGILSSIVSSVVCHFVEPAACPMFLALGRGVAAARSAHEAGGGKSTEPLDEALANRSIRSVLRFDSSEQKHKEEPASIFRTAFNHNILSHQEMRNQTQIQSDLLRDVTGFDEEFVAAKAFEIVMRGYKKALEDVPMASYGNYVTADREEIERINAIKNLIAAYEMNRDEQKPLSIAVFGPPGSGKSFAIKQLAEELFGKNKAVLEFNLTQFTSRNELHVAFHKVRDASIKNKVPLVFWDEFDANKFEWLKEFLAPMQDAEFVAQGVAHPFGKAIFVFAGGTRSSFQDFCNQARDSEQQIDAKVVKRPDFVSRLRGYVNIKGPNPAGSVEADPSYIIRRAILLRSVIERGLRHLVDNDGVPSIDPGIINAILRIDEYKHGARSLESIVSMSELANRTRFTAASLPAQHLLDIHVNGEKFKDLVLEGQLDNDTIEIIAVALHNAWCKEKKAAGYVWGPVRHDGPGQRTNPRLMDYEQLPEDWKEDNRKPARLTKAKLHSVGLDIMRRNQATAMGFRPIKGPGQKKQTLSEIEHDIWLRDHLIKGFRAHEAGRGQKESVEKLFIHKDAVAFRGLSPKERKLDEANVEALWKKEIQNHYVIVKRKLRETNRPVKEAQTP
jgi:DNA replication protein DnaC